MQYVAVRPYVFGGGTVAEDKRAGAVGHQQQPAEVAMSCARSHLQHAAASGLQVCHLLTQRQRQLLRLLPTADIGAGEAPLQDGYGACRQRAEERGGNDAFPLHACRCCHRQAVRLSQPNL